MFLRFYHKNYRNGLPALIFISTSTSSPTTGTNNQVQALWPAHLHSTNIVEEGGRKFLLPIGNNFLNRFYESLSVSWAPLYTMEHIRTAKVENVKLLDKVTPKSSPIGTLYLTTSHLIFIDEKEKKELWILHMLMQTIEKPVLTTSGSQLKILCSNFQNVTFMIAVSQFCWQLDFQTPVRFSSQGFLPLLSFSYCKDPFRPAL